MPTHLDTSSRELLMWISAQRRTYGETLDAWRSTCPRLSIWDDALHEGLIRIEPAGTMREAIVALTERGRAVLNPNT